MLKADFHIHISEDPYDRDAARYSGKELIDRAAELGYDVLSITMHSTYFEDFRLTKYARKKGILLIPGIELRVSDRHVLIINPDPDQLYHVKKLSDLRKIKGTGCLIMPAHPYLYFGKDRERELEVNAELFDAIEFCHFHLGPIDFNKKTENFSRRHKLPMFGSSDTHLKCQFGTTYTMIDSKKDTDSVISAVKKGKVKVVSPDLKITIFLRIFLRFSISMLRTIVFGKKKQTERYSVIKKGFV